MTEPRLRIRGLKKAFGAKQVLDGVDLDVGVGESLVVIGGSGTGKSVLLKCILGLMKPDAGSIRLDGQELVGLSGRPLEQARARFGMLFQGGALFDSLTVWRNVTPTFIGKSLHGEALPVENGGIATRDFIVVATTRVLRSTILLWASRLCSSTTVSPPAERTRPVPP